MSWFHAPAPLLPDLIAQNGRWLANQPALIDGAVSLTWREFGRRHRAGRERARRPAASGRTSGWRC